MIPHPQEHPLPALPLQLRLGAHPHGSFEVSSNGFPVSSNMDDYSFLLKAFVPVLPRLHLPISETFFLKILFHEPSYSIPINNAYFDSAVVFTPVCTFVGRVPGKALLILQLDELQSLKIPTSAHLPGWP